MSPERPGRGLDTWVSLAVLTVAFAAALGCELSSREPKREAKDAAPEVPTSPWTLTRLGYQFHAYAVASVGGDFYIAGPTSADEGVLMKSSDQGAHFTELYRTRNVPDALAGTAADDLWAAECYLRHSSDGGLSWQDSFTQDCKSLLGVWAIDREHVVAVGYRGDIVVTSDGGKQWSVVLSDESLSLYAVWASGLDDIYVAGGIELIDPAKGNSKKGVLLHSADGGVTWQKLISDAGCPLRSVWGSPDGRVVVAGGDYSTLVWTHDHGATWKKETQAGGQYVLSTNPDNPTDANVGVWISPSAQIYILKTRSVLITNEKQMGTLEELPSETRGASTSWSTTSAITGSSDNDIWVVGNDFVWHRGR